MVRSPQPDSNWSVRSCASGTGESQADQGIDHIPSGDFSLYDHVLDTAVLVGAVPERYTQRASRPVSTVTFAMARGGSIGGTGVTALEMTKWFDTNYHYLVPELSAGAAVCALVDQAASIEVAEARGPRHRHPARTARPGVVPHAVASYLSRKGRSLDLLPGLLPGLCRAARRSMEQAGAEWVQVDEPVLGLDLDDAPAERLRPRLRRAPRGRARSCKLSCRHLLQRAGRQPADRVGAAGRRLAPRRGGRPGQVDVALRSAPGTGAVSGRRRRPQCLADRPGRDV